MDLPNAVGLAGVVIILIAYAGVQVQRLDAVGAVALALNFVGASLILVSLYYDFNLSAVLMEGSWALISLAGLVRVLVRRR